MKPTESRSRNRVSGRVIVSIVVGVIGILAFAMTSLVVLSYNGIYVDALRPFWAPWPSDSTKVLVGSLVSVIAGMYFGVPWRREKLREPTHPKV